MPIYFPGNFGLSYDQSAAQLALWAGGTLAHLSHFESLKPSSVFASPLILSVDLRTIRPEFTQLLQVSRPLHENPAILAKVAQYGAS